MRIIFLDIDGVLITPQSGFRGGSKGGLFWYFVPRCLGVLNFILEVVPGSRIVISGSMRKIFNSTEDMIKSLEDRGITPGRIIDRTPSLGQSKCRGREINLWLKDNRDLDIKSFVILDDDNDIDPHMDRWVRTTWLGGLTWYHFESIIKLLNEECKL
jgi:hypothetical protein